MRRANVAAAAAVVAAAVAVAAAQGVGDRTPAPHLGLVSLTPITVRGSGYRPNERVRVVLSEPHRSIRIAASARGAIVVRFAGVDVDHCTLGDFVVTATGAAGERAVVKYRSAPACPPPA